MTNKQIYANVADPHVSALVGGRYRFERLEIALKKIEFFKEKFTVAREGAIENVPEGKHCIVMWIADYDVTQEEEEKGYMGNYAFVAPEEMPNGLVTLACVKLEVDMKYHPRRRRPKQSTPNWGHPILRGVKKGKRYPTIEAAQMELDNLHIEFPEVTIPPSVGKLYVMIFDRKVDAKKPTQKYVLEVETHEEGGYYITYKLNDYNKKEKVERKKPTLPTSEEAVQPQGYFSSMIALKKTKKGKVDPLKAAKEAGEKQRALDSQEEKEE